MPITCNFNRILKKTNSPDKQQHCCNCLWTKKKGNKINGNAMYDKVCLEGDKLTYVDFYDNNGEIIGSYSNNGWSSNGVPSVDVLRVKILLQVIYARCNYLGNCGRWNFYSMFSFVCF
jgi:hypothetical protein